jgi:hypothetical protein
MIRTCIRLGSVVALAACSESSMLGPGHEGVADQSVGSIAASLAASPVSGGPEISRFTEEFHGVLPQPQFCGGFDVQIDGKNLIIVQVFEDHLLIHQDFTATLTNLSSGFALRDPASATAIVRLDAEGNRQNVTVAGSNLRITIPGLGIVAQDMGIITFTQGGEVLFEAGPHQYFLGDGADLCALLAAGGRP